MDKSLNTLTPLCDFVARTDNEGSAPHLRAFEAIDTTGSWNPIQGRFATPYSASEFPHALSPLHLRPIHAKLLPALGFNTPASNASKLVLHEIKNTTTPILQKLKQLLPANRTIDISPPCKVTLTDFARRLAGIPSDAEQFFYAFPYYDETQKCVLNEGSMTKAGFTAEERQDALVTLLLNGGFGYCQEGGELVALNSVMGATDDYHSEALLVQFGMPSEVSKNTLAAIPSQRFQPVTLPVFLERGEKRFAWINPGEAFNNANVGGSNGAFLYSMGNGPSILFPVTS
eukprot:TRINITY_DN109256_c0_g1_i1.p1 TRINITY_DN109256_c0_g1~~TRINITY_DN109256_c0_g1_i1.p1  ORF type:complete len:287 (-),score=35.86 TRINITY_DN109256_c0_g1_i1:65-925(-)